MMNRSVQNYGQSSSSRKIRKRGCTIKPSYPRGNHMNPLQGGNQNFRLEGGGNHLYPIQLGGNRMYPLQGGNHLYPIHQGGNHMYPLQGGNPMIPMIGGNPMIPIGVDVSPNYVFPLPPLSNFPAGMASFPFQKDCFETAPRSALLDSLDDEFDDKTRWVKLKDISDEEHFRIIKERVSKSKAFRNGGYKANKPPPFSEGYAEYDYSEFW